MSERQYSTLTALLCDLLAHDQMHLDVHCASHDAIWNTIERIASLVLDLTDQPFSVSFTLPPCETNDTTLTFPNNAQLCLTTNTAASAALPPGAPIIPTARAKNPHALGMQKLVMEKTTPEWRSANARKAANARWQRKPA